MYRAQVLFCYFFIRFNEKKKEKNIKMLLLFLWLLFLPIVISLVTVVTRFESFWPDLAVTKNKHDRFLGIFCTDATCIRVRTREFSRSWAQLSRFSQKRHKISEICSILYGGYIARNMIRSGMLCRIITVLAVILEISAVQHWRLTANGKIEAKVCSSLPYDFT